MVLAKMKSCIFLGQVKHRRMVPVEHGFTYRMFMMYLDLAELPEVFSGRWFWSARGSALARFRRRDHYGDPAVPLDQSIRDLVLEQTGARPQGPVRLLTNLRYFGYVFNPVSFYYCFNQDDTALETIVAEVNNTPWGERHCYVLPQEQDCGPEGIKQYFPEKQMHVSPFMEMDVDYDWRFNTPSDHLNVHMQNSRKGNKVFDATLLLKRKEITPAALSRVLISYPFMTFKIVLAIHWEALKLWLKGAPVHDHPDKKAALQEKTS
jgi:DUF1365 family protein